MYGRVFYHVKLYVYEYTNNLRGPNELWRGRVTAARHTSAEWYLFGGCNVLVVTTFRTGLLLFPLLFIVITRTWWVRQHLLWMIGSMTHDDMPRPPQRSKLERRQSALAKTTPWWESYCRLKVYHGHDGTKVHVWPNNQFRRPSLSFGGASSDMSFWNLLCRSVITLPCFHQQQEAWVSFKVPVWSSIWRE
jgi:hypothetical protein